MIYLALKSQHFTIRKYNWIKDFGTWSNGGVTMVQVYISPADLVSSLLSVKRISLLTKIVDTRNNPEIAEKRFRDWP
jgi:hypothetical protein